jgi:hypothetical protein
VIPWRLELGGSSEAELFEFMAALGYRHEHLAAEDVLFTKRPPDIGLTPALAANR